VCEYPRGVCNYQRGCAVINLHELRIYKSHMLDTCELTADLITFSRA
jgi:hypothetical protein